VHPNTSPGESGRAWGMERVGYWAANAVRAACSEAANWIVPASEMRLPAGKLCLQGVGWGGLGGWEGEWVGGESRNHHHKRIYECA
jgi:hypothetical protein